MEASASSSSLVDPCLQVCLRFQHALERGSVLILHRSKWQCLVRTYSHVLQALVQRIEHTSSRDLDQAVLCQELVGSLEVVLHAMQEAERCFNNCTCPVSNIDHSWLVGNALKLGTSTDVVEIHLHDFIWSYAVVLEQAFWLGICFDHTDFDSLKQETCALHELWAAEDTRGDLCEAREQLLHTIKCDEENETSQLTKFLVQKLTRLTEDSKAHNVLPDFLWVDSEGVRRNPDCCIGKGAFGVVHEAAWLGGRFAVKDIFYSGEEAFTERERAIQARLHHPNVMSLICCTKNMAFERFSMVMELMQQDLHLMLKKRKREGKDPPCTLLEAVDLMLQIAKGMEYLHSVNVIHRDLKSSNVLVSFPYISSTQLSHHTHLKIADFGMAKAKEMSAYFTTKPAGTLAWRAPEVFQFKGVDDHTGYSKKADVYSFGLVCYEILTGEFPFIELRHLHERVIKGERPHLPSYCPRAVASFIQRCWDTNPKVRPGFACICSWLRYFKARILLGNLDNLPSAAHSWVVHSLSSSTIPNITDMLQSQDRSLGVASPVNILLEMYQCRLVLQESSKHCEDDGKRGSSDHATCWGRSRWNVKWLFKRRLSKSQQVFSPGFESVRQATVPGIDNLQIFGHAMVGEKILTCGYSINGTTRCRFQWVRHHRDGTCVSIPGADYPEYTITVDDLDTFLSVEVVPMDDARRDGVMVEAFLEDRKWISEGRSVREHETKSFSTEQAYSEVNVPLPGVDGLRIAGLAMVGEEIFAIGYSINGTTLCQFQWVRHHRDGTRVSIPEAFSPSYTITADDLDTFLSVEVVPMDDTERKGAMVEVFLEDRKWISGDVGILEQVTKYVTTKRANFEVKILYGESSDPGRLRLTRSMCELTRMDDEGHTVSSAKFSLGSTVKIVPGRDSQCEIIFDANITLTLDCASSRIRDVLVLTMREFIKMVLVEKKEQRHVQKACCSVCYTS